MITPHGDPPNPFRDGQERQSSMRTGSTLPSVVVLGTGVSHPENAVPVGELEPQLVSFRRDVAGMDYASFTKKHFGAETVYVDSENHGLSYYLAEAGQRAMDRAGVTSAEISAVVLTTITAEDAIAGARGLALERLEMYEKHCVELHSACTGFMDALSVGRDRALATGELVLVLGGDTFRSRFVNPTDYVTCGLFGDAAAAAVLGPGEPGFGFRYGRTVTNADWRKDARVGDDGYFAMDSKALGARIPASFAEQFLRGVRRNAFDSNTTIAIPHQVNGRLLQKLIENLRVPAENLVNVFHKYGNCANASIGLALHHAFRDGMLRRGTNAVLFGAGAGFNFGYLGFTSDRELPERTAFRVMFVDDEPEVARALVLDAQASYREDGEFQKYFSFETVILHSAEQALLQLVEDRTIAVVVTDQRMGAMSGAVLVEILKRRARDLGYVMVTGFAEEDGRVIEEVGFSAVIRKPCDPAVLWSALKSAALVLRNRDGYRAT